MKYLIDSLKRLAAKCAVARVCGRIALDWDESKHPRGNKNNAGQFTSKKEHVDGNEEPIFASRVSTGVEPLTPREMDKIARMGVVSDSFCRGWILPDGRNVEFVPSDDGWVDHDDVRKALDPSRGIETTARNVNDCDAREMAVNAGGIRYHMLGDEGFMDIHCVPSKDQRQRLNDFINYDHERLNGTNSFVVSFSPSDYIQYPTLYSMRKRLMADIDKHFNGVDETPDSYAVRMFH